MAARVSSRQRSVNAISTVMSTGTGAPIHKPGLNSDCFNAVVEADGSVKDVEIVQSLDTELGLDDQATTALKQWEFKPGLWMGEPVPVLITVEMAFTLR